MALINPHFKTLFVHVYKTGGTSIRKYIGGYEVSDSHATARVVKYNILSYTQENIWESYFKFAVVRNPYDLLISLHYHLLNQPGHLFSKYATDNINDFIDLLPFLFKNSNFNGYMFFAPQYEWVSDDNGVIIDKVYKFSCMDSLYTDLDRITGGNSRPFLNISKNRDRNIPFNDIYSTDSINIINELYSVDFMKFGFEKICA